jgi:hypothetical protein
MFPNDSLLAHPSNTSLIGWWLCQNGFFFPFMAEFFCFMAELCFFVFSSFLFWFALGLFFRFSALTEQVKSQHHKIKIINLIN